MKRLNVLRQALIYARGEAELKQSTQYNTHHRKVEFDVGELVLKRTHPLSNSTKFYSAGLEKPFEGPFIITQKFSATRYEVSDFSGVIRGEVSISDLKPWVKAVDREVIKGPPAPSK